MKKYHKLMLLLILTPSVIDKVYASCTKEEMDYFKSIEDNYKITVDYDKNRGNYVVSMQCYEPEKYCYTIFTEDNISCEKNNNNIIECYNFTPNKEYKFTIDGRTSSCDSTLKELNVKIPKYNEFSKDSLCQGIEEFVLCQPTYDKEIDYNTFVSRAKSYKKSKEKEEEKIKQEEEKMQQEKENSFINKAVKYLKDNAIMVISIILFTILIIITIIVAGKSAKKSRRLE